ncbi:MAG: hypothetical protein J7M18_02260 [Candidatus Eremiobacteraeota bacterium]|nr:hypothetical protein [Candidatus Eremiobacteraeota bacterium]
MSKGKAKKESQEILSGFSFSRMHRMLREKKKEEEKKSVTTSKKTSKKARKKTSAKKKAEPQPVNPVSVPEKQAESKIIPSTSVASDPITIQPPLPSSSQERALRPEVVSPPSPPLPELPSTPATLPKSPQQFTPPARNLYPASRFAGGEKRTTIRISTDLADRAKEFENQVYWLTKKRLSLAEQARIALTLFLELPLELEDMTADDDMELFILQKARKLLSHLPLFESQPGP